MDKPEIVQIIEQAYNRVSEMYTQSIAMLAKLQDFPDAAENDADVPQAYADLQEYTNYALEDMEQVAKALCQEIDQYLKDVEFRYHYVRLEDGTWKNLYE